MSMDLSTILSNTWKTFLSNRPSPPGGALPFYKITFTADDVVIKIKVLFSYQSKLFQNSDRWIK